MTTSPNCIVAVASDDNRYPELTKAAIDTARANDATLIFYDIDAASWMAKPLPTWWSAGGAEEQVPDRLIPEDLTRAGREPLARLVQSALDQGVEAYGWLPGEGGGDSLAQYAEEQGADLIMLPHDADHPGLIDRMRGRTAQKVADETSVSVVLVDKDGTTKPVEVHEPAG